MGVIYLTKVPVAFICDSHFVIATAVALTSLMCNKNPDTYYDIYIIAVDLSEMEMKKFYEFKGGKADIHIIKVSLEKYEDMQQYGLVNSTAYLKFDLPDLIPNQDKVLYLDGDILIQKDLSDLFGINIEDDYAGAVKSILMIDNALNLKNYFFSGVMLLNLKLMRENNTSTALLNIGRSVDKLKFMDQDCFNILFNNKVKFLPIIYDCPYNLFLKYRDKYTLESINKYYETNYLSFDNIKKDSYIIHFAGHEKPWTFFDVGSTGEWDEYFKNSPYKHHKLKRRSKKLRELMFSRNLTKLLYLFFMHWRYHDFKFAMGKVKKIL
jgi:lipopolysaccharide biosynthesis glycosyltransferase